MKYFSKRTRSFYLVSSLGGWRVTGVDRFNLHKNLFFGTCKMTVKNGDKYYEGRCSILTQRTENFSNPDKLIFLDSPGVTFFSVIHFPVTHMIFS